MLADPLTPLFPTEPSVRYALTLGLAVCATDPVHSERALHRFLVGEHKNPGEIRRPQGPKMKESLPYPQYVHQTAEFLRFQGNQPGQEFNVSVDHRGTGFLTGERKCYPSQAVGRLIFSGNSCEQTIRRWPARLDDGAHRCKQCEQRWPDRISECEQERVDDGAQTRR